MNGNDLNEVSSIVGARYFGWVASDLNFLGSNAVELFKGLTAQSYLCWWWNHLT